MAVDLAQLQDRIKREPSSYLDEFLLQWQHYEAQLDIFRLSPTQNNEPFAESVRFLAHVAPFYDGYVEKLAGNLMSLLEEQSHVLHRAVRLTIVQSLALLRNRGALAPDALMKIFFKLFRLSDKNLRQVVFSHIVNDIKRMNYKHKDIRVNRVLQNFLFSMLSDGSAMAARKSLDVIIELYRANVWNDSKTVNVLSTACFHSEVKVYLPAVRFLLGADDDDDDDGSDSSDDDEGLKDGGASGMDADAAHLVHRRLKHSKKKRARVKKITARLKKKKKRASMDGRVRGNAALQMLNDPQGFAEKLFDKLRRSKDSFEVRLDLMDLISRLIGIHDVVMLAFYPFCQKYVKPRQEHCTKVLAYLVQAVNEHVPEDVLLPVVRSLADHFVNDITSPEVMSVGLNTIREICTRQPLAIEGDLLRDLVQYKSHKDKGVMAGARSLMQLYRDVNPELLARKDRGRGADMDARPSAYGANRVARGVEGAELLDLPEGASASSADELESISGDEADFSDADEEAPELIGDVGEEADSESSASDAGEGELDNDDGSEDEAEESGDSDAESSSGSEAEDDGDAADHAHAQPLPDKHVTFADAADVSPEEEGEDAEHDAGSTSGKRAEVERIFSQEDFARIKRLREKMEIEDELVPSRKRSREELARVRPEELESIRKRKKLSLEERLERVREGRIDKQAFSIQAKKANKTVGRTNEDKKSSKNFKMLQHSRQVQTKIRRSLHEKNVSRSQHVQKKKKGKLKKYSR